MATQKAKGNFSPSGFSVQDAAFILQNGQRFIHQKVRELGVISDAVDQLGAAIQSFTEDRSADEIQSVVTAARILSQMIPGPDYYEEFIPAMTEDERSRKLESLAAWIDSGEGLPAKTGGAPW
jgi:hypothetical protein